jgi:hypothetical protein
MEYYYNYLSPQLAKLALRDPDGQQGSARYIHYAF